MMILPEISLFFEKEKFTFEELSDFKIVIAKKYSSDHKIIKLAESNINLYLLKYELVEAKKQITKPSTKVQSVKPKRNYKDTSSLSLSAKLEYYREKDIYFILNEITDTKDKQRFMDYLKEKGIYKGRINIILSQDQYSEILPFLENIIRNNKKRNTSKKVKSSKNILRNRSLPQSENVFEKAKRAGGFGKIIFIRTK